MASPGSSGGDSLLLQASGSGVLQLLPTPTSTSPQQPCLAGVSPFTKALSSKRVAKSASPTRRTRPFHAQAPSQPPEQPALHSAYVPVRHHTSAGVYLLELEHSAKLKCKHGKQEQDTICTPFMAYQAFAVHFHQDNRSHSWQRSVERERNKKKQDRVERCLNKFKLVLYLL